MTAVAIGLGVILSLFFLEVFGMAAAGIVVPGYIALNLNKPSIILSTLIVSLIVYLIMKILTQFAFIFGRRRLAITLLLGFIFGYFYNSFIGQIVPETELTLKVVGFIIPGLIANWMLKQSVIEMISALAVSSIIVKLILMLIFGMEVSTYV
ncbi:MAG: poly-gamma-glutamate biosynthesis protein PgsC [Candidatus Cloacimonadota bacterium]|nr:MAG: poly-gamma-glutamate biosynthesis protein PgsC [Candidatus Cloacimonadota bacterium]